MTSKLSDDIAHVWIGFKKDMRNQALRNQLMERYLPLVKYNAERVWAKLPEGVDLNDLMSAVVLGPPDFARSKV